MHEININKVSKKKKKKKIKVNTIPYIYPRIPLEYPKIPFECPRIPQNTNNIKILNFFHWGVYTDLKERWLSDGHLKVDNTKESIRWKKNT
jgi:hypothetical protein